MKSRKSLKWLTLPLALVMATSLVVTGCSEDNDDPTPTTTGPAPLTGTLDIIGSNTVTPISTAWAEEFMNQHPQVNISVSGPGSSAGIAALINQTTTFAQASRSIKQSEIDQAKANGVDVVETIVGLDALSVVVNPNNPVDSLTIEQLSDIYTGKVTNWSEVGGNNAPIVLLSRDTNSGTYAYFLEEVVQLGLVPDKEDSDLQYAPAAQLLPSTTTGITQVSQNANAIFYAGMGYVDSSVKALGIKKTENDEAVVPSLDTAKEGTYPIARFLYYYTAGQPEGLTKAFIDYGLSAAGQAIVEDLGFVAVQ